MKNDIQAVKKVECQQSICWFSFLKPTKKMRLDESHETLQECCERTTKSKRIINHVGNLEYYEEKLKALVEEWKDKPAGSFINFSKLAREKEILNAKRWSNSKRGFEETWS